MTLLLILAAIPGVAACLNFGDSTEKTNGGLQQMMFLASVVALFFAPLVVLAYWAACWAVAGVWLMLRHSIRAQTSACKYPD
mgnify:FL=1